MSLQLRLERPLPDLLPTGSATAVFLVGSCFHPTEGIERLQIVIDDVATPVAAHGLPRPDVADAHPSCRRQGFFSGFWVTLPIPARAEAGSARVALRAVLTGGQRAEVPVGTIEFIAAAARAGAEDLPPAARGRLQPGVIAICMATFEPDESLFRAQIESLRAQDEDNWICLISDDASAPEHFERIVAAVGEDPRFAITRSADRVGPYRNFERTLRSVPADVELVALCDQDDRWHPGKLRTLRAAIGAAVLVYSDMRLVEADGRVLRDTLWRGRRNAYGNLASMLVANTITGASTMFRRELLDLALPFPDPPGFQFHDHWLAVVALAAGRVAYVERPLYDYVQHPGAVFGDVTHGQRPTMRQRLAGLRELRRLPRWRASYFYGYLSRQAQAQVVLMRCARLLSPAKRRALQRFVSADRSLLGLLWLACRPVRGLVGRTETLGTELELVRGIVWKRLIVLRARHWPHERGRLSDASIPPPQSFREKRLRRWRGRI